VVTRQQDSTHKSNPKAKGGKKTRPSRIGMKRGNVKGEARCLDVVDAASAVKELCTHIGAEKVKRLTGLFE
jgi:hypothetical protein